MLSNRLKRLVLGVIYFLFPIAMLLVASIRAVNGLLPIASVIAFALLILALFIKQIPRQFVMFLWTFASFSIMAASGGFNSVLFFVLYLTAIALGFVYTPGISISFVLGNILAFLLMGETNSSADFIVYMSLLSAIPMVIVLRRAFLLVQQERKGILILETDNKRSGITSLDEVLDNKVNNISTVLRQPITYIRQGLAMVQEGKVTDEEFEKMLPRMQRSADELFTLLKEFERGTTNNTLLGSNNADKKKK